MNATCYCEIGELCRHCLGEKASLLTAVPGSDGMPDVAALFARSELTCSCGAYEVCRFCLPTSLRDEIAAHALSPFEDAPEDMKSFVDPLDYLDMIAAAN